MILYHGTSESNGKKIMKEGFIPDKKYNWKIKSKSGFVYLSLAYAPFYAETAKNKSNMGAIIKVEVDERKLYPEDDFIMYSLGRPKYTQDELDAVNVEKLRSLYKESLKYMGNVCGRSKDIKIIGVSYFDMSKLLFVCDPVICPMNYKIMGSYYLSLTEWIYEGNLPQDFGMAVYLNLKKSSLYQEFLKGE